MIWKRLIQVGALAGISMLSACGVSDHDPQIEFIGGCSHENVLPELKLTAAHESLLAGQSDPPRTALDFYLVLPVSFFGNVEDTTPERRVTFIEMESLSEQWLHASHFFECDGGGFEITLRIFDAKEGRLIAIEQWEHHNKPLYEVADAKPGEIEMIALKAPTFWRCVDGVWAKAEEVSVPMISKDAVLDRYKNCYQPRNEYANASKYIWLNYDLPKKGNVIRLTGRANFMEPDGDYVWQRLEFDGSQFKELPLPN